MEVYYVYALYKRVELGLNMRIISEFFHFHNILNIPRHKRHHIMEFNNTQEEFVHTLCIYTCNPNSLYFSSLPGTWILFLQICLV